MKLVLTQHYSNEVFCGVDTYPFTYESLEKAEYDFLQLYEDTKKSYNEYISWMYKNRTELSITEYHKKFEEFAKTHITTSYFKFLTIEFDSNEPLDNISFLTLEDWFTNNEI